MKTQSDFKKIITLAAFASSVIVYSQVGINNQDPKATLDITAKSTGSTTVEGLISPRLEGSEILSKNPLYGTAQKGTILYAKSASPNAGVSGDKTTNINSEGYYYFDGNFWIKFGTPSGQIPDTSIYKDDGSLTANRNANLNGYNLGFTGNGNVGIGTSTPTEKLQVLGNVAASGNGKFSQKLTVGSNYVGAALAVDNNDASQPIMAISGTSSNRRITVFDNGNTGIGTQAPSEKLDVEGNARFRSVPAGNMSSTDDYLAVSSNGTLKKVDVNLPALGLFAVTTGYVGHPSDNNIYDLNFDNIQRRDGNFIATSIYQNTFVAVKYGLYTVEVWASFSTVPQDFTNGSRGCTLRVVANGNPVQIQGDRWAGGEGTAALTKTVILNANETLSVHTRCTRTNDPQYITGPGSSMMITYTPL